MTKEELNLRMIKEIPNLKSKYEDEINWQEGNHTGSHVVYGDVLTPYLVQNIRDKNEDEINHVFRFLENILSIDDEYAKEVVTLSVLESILNLITENVQLLEVMGTRTKSIVENLLNSRI